ncbi:hypothetical protein [Streptomyces sp. NPDC008121]|uniref:hypothetical protein n=1 Tax=Streptomyces sp. NPDC008121 TaxID=3364809 RepID=UPI0036E8E08E
MSGFIGRISIAVSAAFLLAAGAAATTTASAAEPVARCAAANYLLTVDDAVTYYYALGGTEAEESLSAFVNGIDTPGTNPAVDDTTEGNGDGYVCIRESKAPGTTIQIGDNKVPLRAH